MAGDLAALAATLELARLSIVGLSMGGRVAIAFAGQHRSRVDRLVVVDIGPDISEAGRVRVGTLLAQTPELLTSLEEAIAFGRATSPRYTEAMLRHRVRHATRPVPGGFAWKYDRALRDAVRSGKWSDTIDVWPIWRAHACHILSVL